MASFVTSAGAVLPAATAAGHTARARRRAPSVSAARPARVETAGTASASVRCDRGAHASSTVALGAGVRRGGHLVASSTAAAGDASRRRDDDGAGDEHEHLPEKNEEEETGDSFGRQTLARRRVRAAHETETEAGVDARHAAPNPPRDW